ncbi:MAG: hypothetical protein ACRDJV_15305 [Actinomycetota bacterium]
MPRSKTKKRSAARQQQARATQIAQQKSEAKKLTPGQYTRRRAIGWTLVALAVVVGVTHWLAHLGALYEDKAVWDLTIGYPTAGILGVAGAIVLSK